MNTDKLFVLGYLLTWVIALIIYYRKKKAFDAGAFIMLSYIVYAFFSYKLVEIGGNILPLKLFPFIYLFTLLIIGMMPVLKLRTTERISIQHPPIHIINTLSLIFIISTLFFFPQSVSRLKDGYTMILTDSSFGMDMYNETMDIAEESGHGISNLASIISNSFTQIGLFLTVYYLTLPNGKKWISIGLLIASFMKMASGVSTGQRGAIVEPLIVLLATYFMLKPYIITEYKKVSRAIGVVIIAVLLLPVFYITLSRFDTIHTNPEESTYFYLGHENVYFNHYALDDGGIRYGDRTIPLFKQMLGFSNVPSNFMERRAKYPQLKVNDEVFVTYVGDIAIDYGPIMAYILITVISLLLAKSIKIKQGQYKFHQVLLAHFVLYMCTIGGIKLFPYSDISGNLKIITFILTYLYFYTLSNPKKKKRIQY